MLILSPSQAAVLVTSQSARHAGLSWRLLQLIIAGLIAFILVSGVAPMPLQLLIADTTALQRLLELTSQFF